MENSYLTYRFLSWENFDRDHFEKEVRGEIDNSKMFKEDIGYEVSDLVKDDNIKQITLCFSNDDGEKILIDKASVLLEKIIEKNTKIYTRLYNE